MNSISWTHVSPSRPQSALVPRGLLACGPDGPALSARSPTYQSDAGPASRKASAARVARRNAEIGRAARAASAERAMVSNEARSTTDRDPCEKDPRCGTRFPLPRNPRTRVGATRAGVHATGIGARAFANGTRSPTGHGRERGLRSALPDECEREEAFLHAVLRRKLGARMEASRRDVATKRGQSTRETGGWTGAPGLPRSLTAPSMSASSPCPHRESLVGRRACPTVLGAGEGSNSRVLPYTTGG